MYFYTDSPSWLSLLPFAEVYLLCFNISMRTAIGKKMIRRIMYIVYSTFLFIVNASFSCYILYISRSNPLEL